MCFQSKNRKQKKKGMSKNRWNSPDCPGIFLDFHLNKYPEFLRDERMMNNEELGISFHSHDWARMAAATFAEGTEVEIHNLKNAKYNGIIGKICGPLVNGRYPVKVDGRENPFNLKPANLQEMVYEVPREMESMFSMLERKIEIDRIIGAFKLDPFAILDLPYSASGTQIQKHFRKVSLRCHPDKVPEEMRDRAQEAFAKLQAAKASLTNAKKRLIVNEMVDKAKRRVLKVREDRRQQEAAAAAQASKAAKAAAPTRKQTDAEKLLKLLARDKEEEGTLPTVNIDT
eukprot:jgi/Bigna1/86102/estExt_fgenesh1_pg.C_80086